MTGPTRNNRVLKIYQIFLSFKTRTLSIRVRHLNVTRVVQSPGTIGRLVPNRRATLILRRMFRRFRFLRQRRRNFTTCNSLVLTCLRNSVTTRRQGVIVRDTKDLNHNLVTARRNASTNRRLAREMQLNRVVIHAGLGTGSLVSFNTLNNRRGGQRATLLAGTATRYDTIGTQRRRVGRRRVSTTLNRRFRAFLTDNNNKRIMPLTYRLMCRQLTVKFLIFSSGGTYRDDLS